MTNPLQRLQQSLLGIENIRNDRRSLDQGDRQLKLNEALSAAQMISGAMEQAQQTTNDADKSLALLYGKMVGPDGTPMIDPEVLGQLFTGTPNSTQFYDRKRADRQDQIEEMPFQRILDDVALISDENLRDIATENVTIAYTGAGSGSARTSVSIGDREVIDDIQMRQSLQQQMNLVMSPQELKQFNQIDTELEQTWTSIGDLRNWRKASNGIQMMELAARERMQANALNVEMGMAADDRLSGITPQAAIDNIAKLIPMVGKAGVTDATRRLVAAVLVPNVRALGDLANATGDPTLGRILSAMSDDDMVQIGPSGVLKAISTWLGGSSSPASLGGRDMFQSSGDESQQPKGQPAPTSPNGGFNPWRMP